MYSRFPSKPEPVRLPEHHSGCAFSPQPPHDTPRDPHPQPPASEQPSCAEIPFKPMLPPPPPPEQDAPPERKPALSSLFGSLPSLPGGMGFDELLLLGLILLLAHSEEGSDVVLWLALLLFCK